MDRRVKLAGLLLFAFVLAACAGAATPLLAISSRAGAASGLAAPAITTTASPLPPTALPPPTPTSLADGLTTKLGTPDPSPNCPDHYPWFFENPAEECGATILNTWAAFETFEHGLMVWTQEGGHTYVLIDDGSPFKPFQEVVDLQGLPLTEADPSLSPPPGRFQPILGFGKFWRGLVPGAEWVRQRLGWATAPESAYSAFWQCNQSTGDAARCYVNGPRDEVIVMTRGSAQYWTYWQRSVR